MPPRLSYARRLAAVALVADGLAFGAVLVVGGGEVSPMGRAALLLAALLAGLPPPVLFLSAAGEGDLTVPIAGVAAGAAVVAFGLALAVGTGTI